MVSTFPLKIFFLVFRKVDDALHICCVPCCIWACSWGVNIAQISLRFGAIWAFNVYARMLYMRCVYSTRNTLQTE